MCGTSSARRKVVVDGGIPRMLLLWGGFYAAFLLVSARAFLLPATSRTGRQGGCSSPSRGKLMMVVGGGGGWSGSGRVGDRYWWTENEVEMEVVVPVPPGTTKHDVLFDAGVRSIKLGLAGSTQLLLGGQLKGRIALDGSYWSLESEGDGDDVDGGRAVIKVLLDKKEGAPENAMDWRRVLVDEAATEASYGQGGGGGGGGGGAMWSAEEYVEQMLGPGGVNVSLVDKTMFGSGGVMGNVTKDGLKDYVRQKVMVDATTRVPGSEEGPITMQDDDDDEEA